MRVLLLDPQVRRAHATAALLSKHGLVAETADAVEDAVQICQTSVIDLVIIEPDHDGDSGCALLQALRRSRVTVPVILLSDPVPAAVRIRALGLGADDYVTRPFEPEELAGRAAAIVRRANGLAEAVIEVGQLRLDMIARTVAVEGRPFDVTPKEYALLELLGLRRGKVLRRETILDHLYGGLEERHEKVVDVYICRLRRKLQKACGGRDYLRTEWGRGFMLQDPEPQALAA